MNILHKSNQPPVLTTVSTADKEVAVKCSDSLLFVNAVLLLIAEMSPTFLHFTTAYNGVNIHTHACTDARTHTQAHTSTHDWLRMDLGALRSAIFLPLRQKVTSFFLFLPAGSIPSCCCFCHFYFLAAQKRSSDTSFTLSRQKVCRSVGSWSQVGSGSGRCWSLRPLR